MNASRWSVPETLGRHASLARRESRQLLVLLEAQSVPLTPTALAQLWAVDDGVEPETLTESQRERYHVSLVHRLVPELAADGLVEDSDPGLVVTDAGALAAASLAASAAIEDCPDAVCEALRIEQRRAVLRVLASGDRDRTTLTSLAAGVEVTTQAESVPPVDGERLEATRERLHHVDLPKLAAVDLLAYDPESQLVRPRPLPESVRELIASPDRQPERTAPADDGPWC